MTETERIVALEERLRRVECDITDIKSTLIKSAEKSERAAMDYIALTGQLKTLTENLKDHNEWHSLQNEKKYKWTDIILAGGMLALGIMQFMGAGK